MPLSDALARIPGLGGYLAAQEQQRSIDQQGAQNTVQAVSLAGILRKQQLEQQMLQDRASLAPDAFARKYATPDALIRQSEGDKNRANALTVAETRRPTPPDTRPELVKLLDIQKAIPEDVPADHPYRKALQQRIDSLGGVKPQPDRESNLARLMREKQALPAGDPRHAAYDNAIRKESETAKQINPPAPATPPKSSMSDKALDNAAWFQIINGRTASGTVSYGKAGQADREAIRERVAEIAERHGIDPAKLASLGMTNRASASALLQLEKQRNAVEAYSQAFVRNADMALDLSEKRASTFSPLLNRPVNALAQYSGDPDVAKFMAQVRLVQTEAARIINNPNLSGQLTDTARGELDHILNGNMTVGQFKDVVKLLKRDVEIRGQTLDKQAEKLRGEIMGAGTAPAASTPAAPATKPAAKPALPAGFKLD